MDPELAALASAAATTIVSLLATDSWEKGKQALGTLWRRVKPGRAERIEAAITDSREDILAAAARGDTVYERELVAQWEAQLGGLLAAEPAAADVLRDLLEHEMRPALIAITGAPTTTSTTSTVRADARKHSQAFAAGGNMTVHVTQLP